MSCVQAGVTIGLCITSFIAGLFVIGTVRTTRGD